jgi:hypothetical protein
MEGSPERGDLNESHASRVDRVEATTAPAGQAAMFTDLSKCPMNIIVLSATSVGLLMTYSRAQKYRDGVRLYERNRAGRISLRC